MAFVPGMALHTAGRYWYYPGAATRHPQHPTTQQPHNGSPVLLRPCRWRRRARRAFALSGAVWHFGTCGAARTCWLRHTSTPGRQR